MGSRVVGHLRTHVVGYIALVLALSGTAYALERNSVGTGRLGPTRLAAASWRTTPSTASTSSRGPWGAPAPGRGALRLPRPDHPRRLRLRPGGHASRERPAPAGQPKHGALGA